MKYTIYLIMLFLACLVIACDKENGNDPYTPYTILVTGPTSVTPQTTKTYLLGPYLNPETYTWSVEGPADIVGASTGSVVKIKFNAVGSVTLTITNGPDTRVLAITVKTVSPSVKTTLNGAGVLKSGNADTLFFSFPAPLETDPTIAILTGADSSYFVAKKLAFSSGSLGSMVKVDAKNYYAIYTAGTGNGTPEALITGLKSTSTFGSVKVDSAYVQLYKVDNIAPIADLAYSSLKVNDGTVVTITATFTEAVTFKSSLDSALLISFSGAGVGAETDTLQATDNPLVYTYDYTVNGGGNGTVTVAISNTTDLAKNDLATTTNTAVLMVDNIDPVVAGLASDDGDFASLKITSTETGTASYLILKSGKPAPADADAFFSASGVASGSAQVSAAVQVTLAKLLTAGSYDVYFISQDEAGNYSAVVTAALVMN